MVMLAGIKMAARALADELAPPSTWSSRVFLEERHGFA